MATSGGFAPPEQDWWPGISAWSPLCFECVNPESAWKSARSGLAQVGGTTLTATERKAHRPPSCVLPTHRYHLPITTTTPLPYASGNRRNATATGEQPPDMIDGAGRIGTMRGASVQFDAHRLGQIALGIVMGTLAVLAVVFTVAGIPLQRPD